jgi:hypothetical protein
MDKPAFATFNVTAAFPSMESAREAIKALEVAGVDGSQISLLGRDAAEVRPEDENVHVTGEHPDRETADDQMIDKQQRTAAMGVGAGGAAGAAVGALAGLATFAIPGLGAAVGAGVLAMAAGGAWAGAGVGLATTAYANIQQSQAWEHTFAAVEAGRVVVGVHAEDRAVVDEASATLRDEGGQDVTWYDSSGTQIDVT